MLSAPGTPRLVRMVFRDGAVMHPQMRIPGGHAPSDEDSRETESRRGQSQARPWGMETTHGPRVRGDVPLLSWPGSSTLP